MNRRYDRWLSSLFLLAGVALLAVAAYFYYTSVSDRSAAPTLEVETDVAISDAVAGVKQEVSLRLHNHSGKPIRVLGQGGC